MQKIVNATQDTGTLTLDDVVAGTITGGPTLLMSGVATGTLSAKLLVDIETDTITMTPIWQVSADGSTWYSCLPTNGAANVILGTGTGGADASVTVCLPANDAVYGWRFARMAIKSLVVEGNPEDTYQISYNYVRPALSYNRPNQ